MIAQVASGEGNLTPEMALILLGLAASLTTWLGMGAAFAKAGEPGWAAFVPVYREIVLLKLTDKPVWWIVLLACPCVNVLIFLVLVPLELARRFGKEWGFALGLIFLPFIFFPLLGFGEARYAPAEAASTSRAVVVRREH